MAPPAPGPSAVDGAGAVINLAGESIAGKRWTAAQKQRILESRVQATRSLVAAIARATAPPPVFVSGSAVGYYGPRGDRSVTEEYAGRPRFSRDGLRTVGSRSRPAASARTRVVCVRTGLVLARDGGALPQMLPPFWFGVGGPDRIRPTVLAVDPSAGLGRPRALRDRLAVGQRPAQRDRRRSR